MTAKNESILFCGIDLGTSGVRAVCVDTQLNTVASSTFSFQQNNADRRNATLWWKAVCQVLSQLTTQVEANRIKAIAVDGTSGTMIPVDDAGQALCNAMLYNDVCTDKDILTAIAHQAPPESAVHGASSALARAIMLSRIPDCSAVLHEADWIAFQLGASLGVSDENNALKTGYDPVQRKWPDWIENTGMTLSLLPGVLPAGTQHASVSRQASSLTGLTTDTSIITGTTDGCASFLATGANMAGDGVSVLGSTLTIKLLSDKPVYAPNYGIYSHRIGERWLAGGASNTGGKVLANFFTSDQIQTLSNKIDTRYKSSLDYYPLLEPGERFPVNDSQLKPRMQPRPTEDSEFLHALLQGISNIEYQAYQRLEELGAPKLKSIRTVGGGAKNSVWTAMRAQKLGVQIESSISSEAAVGAACLARDGLINKTGSHVQPA